MKIKEYLSLELGEYRQWTGWRTLMEGNWRAIPVRLDFSLDENDDNAPEDGNFISCLGDILQKYKSKYDVSNWSLLSNGDLVIKIKR